MIYIQIFINNVLLGNYPQMWRRTIKLTPHNAAETIKWFSHISRLTIQVVKKRGGQWKHLPLYGFDQLLDPGYTHWLIQGDLNAIGISDLNISTGFIYQWQNRWPDFYRKKSLLTRIVGCFIFSQPIIEYVLWQIMLAVKGPGTDIAFLILHDKREHIPPVLLFSWLVHWILFLQRYWNWLSYGRCTRPKAYADPKIQV